MQPASHSTTWRRIDAQSRAALLTATLLFAAGGCQDATTAPPSRPNAPPSLAVTIGPSGYSVPTDLGTLPGATSAEATGINDKGQIVGVSGGRMFLHTAIGNQKIPGPYGSKSDHAADITNNGQVVGTSYFYGPPDYFGSERARTFIRQPGGAMLLMPSHLDKVWIINSFAYAVNDVPDVNAITVVGEALIHDGGTGYIGFRWSLADGLELLDAEHANDVNNDGAVVGVRGGTSRAHLWTPGGSVEPLAPNLPIGTSSAAIGVNNKTRVVGAYWVNNGKKQGFVWDWYFGLQPMGPLSADYSPHRISDKDRIIGIDHASSRAFTLYNGVFSYLPPLAPGKPTYAAAVNTCGTIVGTAHDANGIARAVKWSRRVCD